jgi:hypothetical protein
VVQAGLLQRVQRFSHQHVDDRFLERRGDVGSPEIGPRVDTGLRLDIGPLLDNGPLLDIGPRLDFSPCLDFSPRLDIGSLSAHQQHHRSLQAAEGKIQIARLAHLREHGPR